MSLRSLLRRCAAVLASMALPASAAWGVPDAASAPASAPAAHIRFDFHSGFLMNLHHFLLDASTRPAHLDDRAWVAAPSAAEMAGLRAAAADYAQRFADRDPVFDEGLHAIDEALRAAPDAAQDARGQALPPGLADELDRAAPIYARCLWPAQDASNRAWIARARTLDARYGAAIQPALERVFAHPLAAEIRDDIVFDTGEFTGAYTNDPPHSLISSGRASYAGDATLEMLYHEATHAAGTVDPLAGTIDAESAAAHRPSPENLWHAAQFYAVGAVVQDVLKREGGIDYVPYAEKNRVFARAWPAYLPLLQTDWRAYVEGQGTMRDAVRAMVARLPPGAATGARAAASMASAASAADPGPR